MEPRVSALEEDLDSLSESSDDEVKRERERDRERRCFFALIYLYELNLSFKTILYVFNKLIFPGRVEIRIVKGSEIEIGRETGIEIVIVKETETVTTIGVTEKITMTEIVRSRTDPVDDS